MTFEIANLRGSSRSHLMHCPAASFQQQSNLCQVSPLRSVMTTAFDKRRGVTTSSVHVTCHSRNAQQMSSANQVTFFLRSVLKGEHVLGCSLLLADQDHGFNNCTDVYMQMSRFTLYYVLMYLHINEYCFYLYM